MTARFELIDRRSEAGRLHNEDASGATGSAAWVIDGVKGPFDHTLTPGPSDAAWYAQALNATLLEQFSGPPTEPLQSLRKAAERLWRAYAAEARPAPPHEQPSACLALAALDAAGMLHLFNIGDCRTVLKGAGSVRAFGASEIETLEKAAIAEVAELRAGTGGVGDPWTELRGMLRRNFESAMNKPGGYWVTHPTLPWLHAVQTMSLPCHEVDHILLASDGFYRLVNVFGVHGDDGLVSAALGKGLAALCAELRSHEADDPSCRRHPRLKARDDSTVVLVRLV